MRTSDGKTPTNLDLFLRLEDVLEEYERRYDCHITFWHVERRYNQNADALARAGATAASQITQTLAPTQYVYAVSAYVGGTKAARYC